MMQNERMTAEAESLSEQEKTGSSAQAKEPVLIGKDTSSTITGSQRVGVRVPVGCCDSLVGA